MTNREDVGYFREALALACLKGTMVTDGRPYEPEPFPVIAAPPPTQGLGRGHASGTTRRPDIRCGSDRTNTPQPTPRSITRDSNARTS